MIAARARRPRSVTGSARADTAVDDADIDLVYRGGYAAAGHWTGVAVAPGQLPGAILVTPGRWIAAPCTARAG